MADLWEPTDRYLFVIDTDRYAGNFERERCAYVTGQIGDCGVGKENAEIARQEVPDEHGCARPVSIFPTPGWFNHGMGGNFRDGQEEEALAHYKEEARKYWKKAPESYEERLRDKIRAECQRKIDQANALTVVQKYPAYMSVAIFFHAIPHKDLIDIMKQRAMDIASRGVGLKGYEHKVGIEEFRLLEQHTVHKELFLWKIR